MTPVRRSLLIVIATLSVGPALASELSYTFLDFQYLTQDVVVAGVQGTPAPGQTVSVLSDTGDGFSVRGSYGIGERFYFAGTFQTIIIDLTAQISNPLGDTTASDDFDLVNTRIAFGYLQELSTNFDFTADISFDTADYDFGSLAGENFDMDDSGVGARVGFRWNPGEIWEFTGFGRYTPVGTLDLNSLEFDTDTLFGLGMRWYFFEDLAVGLEFETGEIDTVNLSMRFSFGRLPF